MKDFLERGEIKRNEDHPSSPSLLSPPPQTDYDSDAENGMPHLIVREPHLHLLSMPNTVRQRRAWGRRERQESINDIIYKLRSSGQLGGLTLWIQGGRGAQPGRSCESSYLRGATPLASMSPAGRPSTSSGGTTAASIGLFSA